MKAILPTASVEQFGGQMQSGAFGIDANAWVFQMISSGIYDDPPHAVCREIICNAVDANVEAGNGHIPVQVSLPGPMSSTLTVRDFGPGISHEDMNAIYCNIGKSTKRGRSDMTGEKGLGSKSPLSYADSFTVSCFGGTMVRHYVLGWNEQRTPAWTLLREVPSDEPQGVEIGVDIRKEDYAKFARHCNTVVAAFGHPFSNGAARPVINGEKEVMQDRWVDTREITPYVRVSEYAYGGNGVGSAAFYMGNVCYPNVPLKRLLGDEGYSQLLEIAPVVVRQRLTFFVPPEGSDGLPHVTPDAGRGTLQTTPRTLAWVLAVAEEAEARIIAIAMEAILAEPTWFDKWVTFDKQQNYFAGVDAPLRERCLEAGIPKFTQRDFRYQLSLPAKQVITCLEHHRTSSGTARPLTLSAMACSLGMQKVPVILVDSMSSWKARVEQNNLDQSPCIGAWEMSVERRNKLAADLAVYGCVVKLLSEYPPLVRQKGVPKAKSEKVKLEAETMSLSKCLSFNPDSHAARWSAEKVVDFSIATKPIAIIPVFGLYAQKPSKGTYYPDFKLRSWLGCDQCPVNGELFGLRVARWSARPLPSNAVWLADVIKAEYVRVELDRQRLAFSEFLTKAYARTPFDEWAWTSKLMERLDPKVLAGVQQLHAAKDFDNKVDGLYAARVQHIYRDLLDDAEVARDCEVFRTMYESTATLIVDALCSQFPLAKLIVLQYADGSGQQRADSLFLRYIESERKTTPKAHIHAGLFPTFKTVSKQSRKQRPQPALSGV